MFSVLVWFWVSGSKVNLGFSKFGSCSYCLELSFCFMAQNLGLVLELTVFSLLSTTSRFQVRRAWSRSGTWCLESQSVSTPECPYFIWYLLCLALVVVFRFQMVCCSAFYCTDLRFYFLFSESCQFWSSESCPVSWLSVSVKIGCNNPFLTCLHRLL